MALDARGSRSDWDERGHHADQRRFSSTIRTKQSEDFAVVHMERDIVHRGEVPILLDDMLDFDSASRGGVRQSTVRFGIELRHYCCPATAALCGLLSPFSCPG